MSGWCPSAFMSFLIFYLFRSMVKMNFLRSLYYIVSHFILQLNRSMVKKNCFRTVKWIQYCAIENTRRGGQPGRRAPQFPQNIMRKVMSVLKNRFLEQLGPSPGILLIVITAKYTNCFMMH